MSDGYIYIPIRTSRARDLSEALFQLQRPPHLRISGEVSRYYCEVIDYQGPPSQWSSFSLLVLPETEDVPIHFEADGTLLTETLSIFVQDQTMTQQELDGIQAAIKAYAGQRVAISSFVPPSWQPYVMTYEQAVQSGFIVEATIETP